MKQYIIRTFATLLAIGLLHAQVSQACTGITLTSQDGAVVFGRTLEWGSFDMFSRLIIVPRGRAFTSIMPDGSDGLTWKAVYGVAGLDFLEKDQLFDGMNEKGLSVNLFYHPGFSEYPEYDPAAAATTLSSMDLGQYLLTTCSSIEEVKAALADLTVIGVLEPAIGMAPHVHFIVTEPSGKAIVLEFTDGKVKIHDAPLGVITNAPKYDWHMINVRNYINLSPVAIPMKNIRDLNFAPLGGGSGMIGLPGDFTPPSRFVRAVAFSQTARPTATGEETMYEIFRILDNFNVPLGAAEGEADKAKIDGIRSATLLTTAYDTRNLIMQYHTQHNRRVRQVDLNKIDFSGFDDLQRFPLDPEKAQDILDVTPGM
jgi:choloylglycine hydrolase